MDQVQNFFGFGSNGRNEEVEHENFCQRMGNACAGVCVGFILFFVAFPVLGWNEFNYVRNLAVLDKISAEAVTVGCEPKGDLNGKLVFASCPISKTYDFSKEFSGTPVDALAGEPLKGVWFSSQAKIYQYKESKECKEEKDRLGGGKTKRCTYTFQPNWEDKAIDSSTFHCRSEQQAGCRFPPGGMAAVRNSGSIPPQLQKTQTAPDGEVAIGSEKGQYLLDSGIIGQIKQAAPLKLKEKSDAMQSIIPGKNVSIAGSTAMFANKPTQVSVGDIRLDLTKALYSVVNKSYLSVLAKQGPKASGIGFSSWRSGLRGTMSTVSWLFEGQMDLDEFMARKAEENDTMVYILRFVGWLMMWFGLMLITKPISLMGDLIPCIGPEIGDLAGCILAYVAFMVSTSLSLFVIAICWLAARPLYGCIFLFVGFLFLGGAYTVMKSVSKGKPEGRPLRPSGGQRYDDEGKPEP